MPEEEPLEEFIRVDSRLHEDMSVFGTEAVRALLLVNGAAAVALVAILPTLLDKGKTIILFALLIGLALLAVGVITAASLNFSRIEAFDALRSVNHHTIHFLTGARKERERHRAMVGKEKARAEDENRRFTCLHKRVTRCFVTAISFIITGTFIQIIYELSWK